MFDISIVNRRYFGIKIDKFELEVEAPKVKTLKKVSALSKAADEDAITELAEAVSMILNKNKECKTVPDDVIDELDYDQLQWILESFFNWLNKEKNSKN
jgi:hypothetical protein